MPKLPMLSGQEVVRILTRHFGFFFISQKGSHIKLQKQTEGRTVTTIVPDHKELARGTLRGILRLAEISEDEFLGIQNP